jgi:tyrosyl-DNA phosphodiesterase-1
LERERLERRKRLRKEAGLDDDDDEVTPAKRQQFSSSSSSVRTDGDNTIVVSSRSSTTSQVSDIPTAEQVFWDGELRQIANRHADPRKDGEPTFRLTEILGKVWLLSFIVAFTNSN